MKHYLLAAAACCGLSLSAHGQWIINEILADPDATLGDANGDGVVNTSADEFVEIFNSTGGAVDIGGWTISDGFGLRHTFVMPTVVADGQAVVVFGAGTPIGSFGGAVVTVASTGSLGLNNGGDTVTLADDLAVTVVEEVYGSASMNQSITRDPDLTGSFVNHSGATGSGGALFSPGTRIDGSAFFELTVSLSPSSVAENAGAGVVSVTIGRTGDTTASLEVSLSSNDDTEAILSQLLVTIPGNQASETFLVIDAVDDLIVDGTQVVTIIASAAGFKSGTADLEVTDNGYEFWISIFYPGVADPGIVGMLADPNGDGLSNVLTFILSGDPTSFTPDILPTSDRDTSDFIFTYRRLDDAASLDPFVEWGTDLQFWNLATDGLGGVVISVDDNAFGTDFRGVGIDRVIVKIPHGSAPKVFGRVGVNTP